MTMQDTFTWIYNIIESCNNDFHFNCADALIILFDAKYGHSDNVYKLKRLRNDKWNAVHSVLV
jgi:hypothetical protein